VLDQLADENPEVRAMAAEILGKIGSARAVDPLIEAFLDRERTVRRAAATALVRIGTPAVDSLIQALKIEDEEVRTLAAEVLGKLDWQPGKDEAAAYYRIAKFQWDHCVEIGAPAVLPLINAFRAPREDSRRAAVASLSKIGAPAVDALIEALRDETEHVYPSAVETLGNIGASAVPALLLALDDEHFVVCKGAAEALGIIGDARAVEPLIRTLRVGVWYVIRKAAADALGRISDERAVDQLVAALGDEYFKVRDSAQESLLRIGKSAVPALNAALTNKEWRIRKAAAEILGKIGDPRSIQPLIPVLEDDDKDVRKAAAWALVPFSHTKLLDDSVKQRILSVMA
jgi:HEAT repeat protein